MSSAAVERSMVLVRKATWLVGRNSFQIGAAALAYVALLHVIYAWMISPIFAYRGNTYRSPDPVLYGAAVVGAVAVVYLLPSAISKASDFFVWMLYFLVVAPSMTVPHYVDLGPVGQAATITLAVGLLSALIIVAARYSPRLFRLPRPSLNSDWVMTAILTVSSVLIYGYVHAHVGLRLKIVAPSDVYELRFQYRDAVASGAAPFLGYVVRWQTNIINPILVARGVFAGRPVALIAGLAGQVVLFPVTGFKMTLFSVPALLGLALFLRFRPSLSARFLTLTVATMTIVSLTIDKLAGGLYLTQYLVFRMILTPGVLTAAHVEVFSGEPKAIWGHSFLSGLVDYPYDETPSFIVGTILRDSEETSANANLFADGYANLGYSGMLVESLLLIGLLWSLNWASKGLPTPAVSVVLLMPIIATSNSGIPTSMLTNGFLPAIIIMLLMPRNFFDPAGTRGLGGANLTEVSRKAFHALSRRLAKRAPADIDSAKVV